MKPILARIKSFFSQKKERSDGDTEKTIPQSDPLDPIQAMRARRESFQTSELQLKTIKDYPIAELMPKDSAATKGAMDSARAEPAAKAMDSCAAAIGEMRELNAGVPNAIMGWYAAQTFIGYQACALIAQNWLVDKACSMPGEDAARNGWVIKAKHGNALSQEDHDRLRALDVDYKLMHNVVEFNRFKNVFGIRVAIFCVDSEDDDYYQKPFNPDGVTQGSYKGISQIDPYWMTPMLTAESTADPANINFYDPEFWIISGKKYHRSHLVIATGPAPADILKPTYIFGGIPLTQRIYERVYAAERTANEAPLLSLNKRTTALHVDLEAVAANQESFEGKLLTWVRYRDNHAVKVLGKDEVMEQFDTSLTDFDSIIMNQFQLVAAIAKTPATKLLGTSPKGFNATGEFESKSYHEELGSIQTHTMQPMVDRHYLLLCLSEGIEAELEIVWNPVDTPTAKELADLNDKKADTRQKYVNMGSVSPDEVRDTLRDDDRSGFNHLSDEDAEETPGGSPENMAEISRNEYGSVESSAEATRAGAQAAQSSAQLIKSGVDPKLAAATAETFRPKGLQGEVAAANAAAQGVAPQVREDDGTAALPGVAPAPNRKGPVFPIAKEPGVNSPMQSDELEGDSEAVAILRQLSSRLSQIESSLPGAVVGAGDAPNGHVRTVMPGTTGVIPSVVGVLGRVPQSNPEKLPKLKVLGLVAVIENPRGTIRSGQDLSGDTWSVKMPDHYGFIKGTQGADGDEVDCFIGQNLSSSKVFVINQVDVNSGEFDEHKCMIGYSDWDSARAAYEESHDGDFDGLETAYEVGVDEFKTWVSGEDLSLPLIGGIQVYPVNRNVV
ncbi:minor head protein [Xanthomonas phage FoX7]|uniref:Minor head protein n=2 Tax=Carpasinavirus XcP1 TaxID=2182344 RepID=A0A858NR56_9CAUD|nr:minor head protein [Xanthomonas phage FoX6]QJB22163.1 minor head protein [Xanthomonas phage FoX7]